MIRGADALLSAAQQEQKGAPALEINEGLSQIREQFFYWDWRILRCAKNPEHIEYMNNCQISITAQFYFNHLLEQLWRTK